MPAHKLPFKKFDWTPEIAYVIGLIATDGNLSKNGRNITMRSSDIQQLENFKKCLSIQTEIVQSKNDGIFSLFVPRVQFSNTQLYNWFLSIGLSPAKTYTIGELKIPDKYFRDFLRGHLDGDGSISTYQDKWNTFKNPSYVYTRLWTRFISASKNHIQWLRENIIQLAGCNGHVWEAKPKRKIQTTSMWILKFGKKESIKLLNWIYYAPDIPCLSRKREVAKKFI
ncbi:MAG: hypothetical protein M1127_01465 [Patescibacteria group bacterium]|nr:hypothetical protein [Patescibacteria group bacterium]